jgi:glycerol-3-phosphate acyltransferase PlsX
MQFAMERYIIALSACGQPRVALYRSERKLNELARGAPADEGLRRLRGNVEGAKYRRAEVVACDGFVGNVALKITEGVAQHIALLLKKALKSTVAAQVGYVLSRNAYKEFRKSIDYTEYGGAPLLGVRGITVIGHGSANANAIKNGVRVAAELAKARVNEKIAQELSLSDRVAVWAFLIFREAA